MAVKETLAEYLRQKKEESEEKQKSIDWKAKRRLFVNSVDFLYQDIEKWLKTAISKKIVQISYEDITLEEEYIGQYSSRVMMLTIGAERIRFEPKGALIMGAAGRVDLVKENKKIVLLMHTEGKYQIWNFLRYEYPDKNFNWPLTKETFEDALHQLLD